MNVTVTKPIRVKSTGKEYLPGQVVDLPEEKAREWEARGLVRVLSSPSETTWESPLFGRLEAPVLEMREKTFALRHPLTDEIVELSRDWLVSLDERSAIVEFDGNKPREEADAQARREFFGLFRKGGAP
jgi:hypothetical protein